MTLKGIDISGWQAGINLAAVPCDFVIVKATGGTGFVNPHCDTQFQGARKAGKRTGVYHFAREVGFRGSAIDEANHFVDSIQGYLDGKTLLVLDFEGDNQLDSVWALAFLNHVKSRTGVKPMIYLNSNALNGANWSSVWAADYGLWLARYAVSTPTIGYKHYDGKDIEEVKPAFPCAMWQFSSTAQLAGYNGNLDVNIFYGDGAAWDAYCRPSGTPAPKPVTAPKPVSKPAPTPKPATPAKPSQCVVEAGDTLSKIGIQFGVDWRQIALLNRISSPYTIHRGQVLNLPTKSTPVQKPKQCIVSKGDSLSSIGTQFGVDWRKIATLNGISAPYTIHPGQVLNLPSA
jgi:GH25 family lysozyme M1 (1,4-beta-N-acetylmuramidase)/LysM repeat protein